MDEQQLEEILKDFRNELNELAENRRAKSIRRSQMTEEELVEDLQNEFVEVLEHVSKDSGVTIGVVPTDEDEE